MATKVVRARVRSNVREPRRARQHPTHCGLATRNEARAVGTL